MIRYRLSDHHPRTPAGAGDVSYPHFPSFASRHAGDSEGRAHEKACFPIEMRTLQAEEQTQPIELHIDKRAFSNAVADALERIAQQIRGE